MNSRFTMAIALLLSSLPYATYATCDRVNQSDLALLGSACDCRAANSKLVANSEDCSVLLGYLVGKEILPDLPNCSFDYKARWKKFVTKYVINRLFLHDAINFSVQLPSAGEVTVLNTDQFLEVALVVFHDLIHQKATGDMVVHGAVTLAREEIVAAILWLLGESNVEELLPQGVTEGELYTQARNEVARFYVDKAIAKLK